MEKKELLYEGKAKKVYTTEDPDVLIVSYKDDATAFNGLKKGTIVGKGAINNRMTNHIFKKLEAKGVPTHLVEELSDRDTAVKKVEIVPLEVIIRNFSAGSFAKKMGMEEGVKFIQPTLEFSYKNDDLGDPLINKYYALALGLATEEEIEAITKYAFLVNEVMQEYFASLNIELIDFKIEFGRYHGQIILADEVSPDTCRLWDKDTHEKLDKYVSPLSERYASREMQYIFSPDKKFKTWRKLWIALAETEKELGLPITDEQIEELKAHAEDINYDVAKERERLVRHDVMSHVYAYGVQCPKAKGIIHLGATSCYVGDNTDIILMTEALLFVKKKLLNVIAELAKFADSYKNQPTLAFTHFQPAQPTTVGKRATLWLMDLTLDLEDLEHVLSSMKLLGSKGTTGTQASFLELFDNDHEKCRRADQRIAEKMGFSGCYAVSGQTYSRKIDSRVLSVLAGIAQSAHKFSNDVRLLQHLKEVEEPFEKNQIGSSAMAYKRNPMRSERIASLANYVMADVMNPMLVASTQWFERTLDDSANKRLSVPEGFLAVDGILDLYMNVVDGLVVYPKVIEKHMLAELPFMATENIMMDAVKAGGDRQELHEKIRTLSMEAGKNVKVNGQENNLLELIAADPAFNLTLEELQKTMDPIKYVGRAPKQVEEFLEEVVNPILEENKEVLGMKAEIFV